MRQFQSVGSCRGCFLLVVFFSLLGFGGRRKGRYYVAAWGVGSFREVDQKKIPLPRPSLFIIFGRDVGSHDFELLLYRLTAGGRGGERN